MSNIIFTQLKEHFKELLEEIMLEESNQYLERCLKELKDYIRVRGYFHSEQSAEKFLYFFFNEKSTKYKNRRLRYSNLIEEVL